MSDFNNPSVAYAFKTGVASSVGYGVTADNVEITSVTENTNRRLTQQEKETQQENSLRRQLSSNSVSVAYTIIFNAAGQFTNVLT